MHALLFWWFLGAGFSRSKQPADFGGTEFGLREPLRRFGSPGVMELPLDLARHLGPALDGAEGQRGGGRWAGRWVFFGRLALLGGLDLDLKP